MKIKTWQILGTVFTLILGPLFHFFYEWSNEHVIVGIFSAINESTWEHLKLLFTPVFLFSIIEYFSYGKHHNNFILVRFLSILLGMLTTVTLFYTYSSIIGKTVLPIDIAIFILSTFVIYYFSFRLLQTKRFSSSFAKAIGIIGMIALLLAFFVFTFAPPQIPLFQDPKTGAYGVS